VTTHCSETMQPAQDAVPAWEKRLGEGAAADAAAESDNAGGGEGGRHWGGCGRGVGVGGSVGGGCHRCNDEVM
jgi:hypothetical protein